MAARVMLAAVLLFASAFPALLQAASPLPPEIRSDWMIEPLAELPVDLPKTRIVLHHTEAFVSDEQKRLTGAASWAASVKHARSAQNFHKHIRGWKDIGYHYLIDWEGRVLEGRPVDRMGAHVENKNTGAIGVVLMGNLSRQRPTEKQLASLRALLKWLMYTYEIPADRITGHYQNKKTTCPGTFLNNAWNDDGVPKYVQIQPLKTKRR
jgi:hypothetical protein